MTSPAQPQHRPALTFEERMRPIVKPHPPIKPARGFFRDIRPTKAKPQAPTEVSSAPEAKVQAEVPPTPETRTVQVSPKESYERVQQELYQVYKQEKRQVPRTPADQMVFVQSYREVVEQLKAIYAQGTGEQPPHSEARWQKCYADTMAMVQTFYGSVQQSSEALAQIKQLFYQFYTQARKKQPQSATPQEAQVSPPAPVQVQNPPPKIGRASCRERV